MVRMRCAEQETSKEETAKRPMNSSDLPNNLAPISCASCPERRRCFLKKALAAGVGGVLGAVPLGAGLAVVLSPLRKASNPGETVFISTLDALPADGSPRRFAVMATRLDAWNKTTGLIGAVYLRRCEQGVLALNVACPHAGCFVDYSPERSGYYCPCHHSSFSLDGAISDPRSPAPRGLDALEVEIRNQKEVWVKFQNFRAGDSQKEVL